MSDIKEIFNASVEAGDEKNTTLRKMIESGMDVTAAVREYTKLAREAGLVLAPKERGQRMDEDLKSFSGWQSADERKAMADELAEKYDCSSATAIAHMKAYAEANGIELPTANRTTSEELVAFVKECTDAGDERADIIQKLQDEFGYTANSAASAISRANRELGIASGGRAKVDLSIIVEKIINADDSGESKKEAAARIAGEVGLSAATVGAYFGYLAFAKEYHKAVSAV